MRCVRVLSHLLALVTDIECELGLGGDMPDRVSSDGNVLRWKVIVGCTCRGMMEP